VGDLGGKFGRNTIHDVRKLEGHLNIGGRRPNPRGKRAKTQSKRKGQVHNCVRVHGKGSGPYVCVVISLETNRSPWIRREGEKASPIRKRRICKITRSRRSEKSSPSCPLGVKAILTFAEEGAHQLKKRGTSNGREVPGPRQIHVALIAAGRMLDFYRPTLETFVIASTSKVTIINPRGSVDAGDGPHNVREMPHLFTKTDYETRVYSCSSLKRSGASLHQKRARIKFSIGQEA